MKYCKKCDKNKNIEEFGKDRQKKDGLCQYCKECIKHRSAKQKKDNPEYFKKYDIKYREENREILREKSKERFFRNREDHLKRSRESYRKHKEEIAKRRKIKRLVPGYTEKENIRQKEWRIKNPEKLRTSIRRWQKKYKEKCNAHQRVHRAVESGILIRSKNCTVCDKMCKTEGHHEDYSKPLEVIWLCRKCHALKIEKVKV